MATRKPALKSNPEPAQVVLPASKLPAFGLLVTGSMCAWRAEQVAKALPALIEPTDAQHQAWALLTGPTRGVLLAMTDQKVFGLMPQTHYDWNNLQGPLEFAPGFTRSDIELLTRATRDAADALRALAATPAFKQASEAYAPILASASPEQLNYPLFARALRLGKAAPEGAALGAHRIPARGTDENNELLSAPWARQALSKSHDAPALQASLGEVELAGESLSRFSITARIKADRTSDSSSVYQRDSATFGFAAAVAPGSQGTRLKPDALFPDARTAARSLDASLAPGPKSSAATYPVAVATLRAAAEQVTTLFLSPQGSLLDSATRYARLGLDNGPLAQASLSRMDFEGRAFLGSLCAPLTRLGLSILPPPEVWKQMPFYPENSELDHIENPNYNWDTLYDPSVDEDDNFYYNYDDNQTSGFISTRLTALSQTPDTLDRVLSRAFLASPSQVSVHNNKALAQGFDPYTSRLFDFETTQNLPKGFEKKVSSLKDVAGVLAKSDPLVGICQWAAAQALTLTKTFSPAHIKTTDKAAAAAHALRITTADGRDQLILALDDFTAARVEIARAFTAAATAAAADTERGWLTERGLLQDWNQAQASGPLTSSSLAWAQANPLGATLVSTDPVTRLAAISARFLGLRGADVGATLRDDYLAELSERGASPEAHALLEADEGLRTLFGALATVDVSHKIKYASNQGALNFCAHALSACARLNIPADVAGAMLRAYAQEPGVVFAQAAATPGVRPQFDGLAPGVGDIMSASAEASEMALALARAKSDHYPRMVDALVEDWLQTLSSAARQGLTPEAALSLAQDRVKVIVERFPVSGSLDWRAKPFDALPAWNVFGMNAPRLDFALSDARLRGGAIGIWCADHLERFSITDAADGNDYIGRCREALKKEFKINDGAWKVALKSTDILDKMVTLLAYPERRNCPARQVELLPEYVRLLRGNIDPYARSLGADPRAAVSVALSAALLFSVAPSTTEKVLPLLAFNRDFQHLFSNALTPMPVSGPEGAHFHLTEVKAKSDRQAKIFVEACRRFDKLMADSVSGKAAPGTVSIDPLTALNEELTDLRDWIRGSEAGLWQTLPVDPTWGQLRRLSKAWHDERHAEAIDRQARAAARQGSKIAKTNPEEQQDLRTNPFIPGSGPRWAKLVGTHQRDGWEAVELVSAADLLEEGTKMHHCVSSYSANCRAGTLRIFSVRLNGERKCTLEISAEAALHLLGDTPDFKISQNKGKHNASVSNEATVSFCRETLAAVVAAWPEHQRRLAVALAKEAAARAVRLKAAADARKAEAAAVAAAHSDMPSATLVNKKLPKAGARS